MNPDHNTYKSDGYNYTQPFPNVRAALKLNNGDKLSIFYNRRVDRPAEVDIRIFPKYDEPELLKVGNPALRPQFTNSIEAGYKKGWINGSVFTALYHRITDGTITRIATAVPGSTILYNVFQNAGRSYNTGAEVAATHKFSPKVSVNGSVNLYRNRFEAFSVINQYPKPSLYASAGGQAWSGNFKLNTALHFKNGLDVQLSSLYTAPDVLPQGKVGYRYSLDAGVKKSVQKGRGEWFANATDLLNTGNVRREIVGAGFRLVTTDYLETQVLRLGYSFKF